MKKYTLLLLFSIFSIAMVAQKKEKIKGNKNVTTVNQNLDNTITTIDIADNLKVTLSNALTNSYTLTTDQNLQDVIQFSVYEGVLKIHTTHTIVNSKKLDISLKLNNNIETILLKDDAEVKSDKVFNGKNITINAQNSSQFDMEIKANQTNLTMLNDAKGKLKLHADKTTITMTDKSNLNAHINTDIASATLSRSAKLRLDGSTDKAVFNTIDSSELDAKRIKISTVDINTKDKSEIHIDVRNNLTIQARDKSKIFVYSEPKIDIKKFADKAELLKR